MTFQYKMATSAGRGVANVGRRCRITLPVARPLIHQSLRSSYHQTALLAAAVVTPHSAPSSSQSATPRAAAPVVQAHGEAATRLMVATSISRAAMTRCVEHRGMMDVVAAGDGRRDLNIGRLSFGTVRGFSTAPAQGGNAKEDSGDVADAAGVAGGAVAPSDDQEKGEGKEKGEKQGSDTPASQEAANVNEEGGEVSKDEFNPLENLPDDDGDPGPPPPLDPSIVTEPPPKVLEIVEAIDSLNFIELAMLIDVFKEKLGIDEVPSLSYGDEEGGEGEKGGGADAGAAAEKSTFKLKVTGFNDKAKIKVIKEIRAITGLGLREAKELVESLPQVIKEDLKAEDAEPIKATLEGAGATVELE